MQRNRTSPASLRLFLGFVLGVLLASGWTTPVQAQVSIPYTEDFETDGIAASRYTASSSFSFSTNDHFQRTDGSDIANVTAPYSGFGGSFFWAGEDLDDPNGDGVSTKTLTLQPIDVSGASVARVSGKFAAGCAEGPGLSCYDIDDFLAVEYSIDGGTTFQAGLVFSFVDPGGGDEFNEPLALDADQDGNGEGTVLTPAMQEFFFDLPSSASTVIVRVFADIDGAAEEFAIDDLSVQEVPPAPPALTEVRPRAAAPGEEVVVYGRGLNTSDQVTIGGVSATVARVSSDGRALTVQVPSGVSGSSPIDVTFAQDGSTLTLANAFDVVTGGSGDYFAAGQALVGQSNGTAEWGDYDGDGDLDLIYTGTDGTTRATRLYQNDGTGALTEVTTGPFEGVTDGGARWGDYNGDGTLDLFVFGQTDTGRIATVYTNDDAGGFVAEAFGITGRIDGDAQWGDVDGDGRLDLVTTGRDNAGVVATQVWFNTGSGFSPTELTNVGGLQFASLDLGDSDGDGDLDLAVSGVDGSNVPFTQVFVNDGTGGFASSGGTFTDVGYGSIEWGDADEDGDLDLLVTGTTDGAGSATGAETEIYRNLGGNSFAAVSPSLQTVTSGQASWIDADGDGDLDVVVTGTGRLGFSYHQFYSNDGTATFRTVSLPLTSHSDSDLSVGDVDADGDQDYVLIGNDGTGPAVTVFENRDPQELIVQDGGNAIPDGGSFFTGTTPEGTDLTATLTLENPSTETALTLSAIDNSNADFFSIVSPTTLPVTIPAGGTIPVDVSLSGTTAGFYSTTLTFQTDDPLNTDYNVSVDGFVQAQQVADVHPSAAVAGASVQIYGAGFDAQTTVSFSGTPGAVTDVQPSVLTVTVPSGLSSPAAVDVTFGDGTTVSVPGGFFPIAGGPGYFAEQMGGIDGLANGDADWGDYDQDGDLDLVVIGEDGSGPPNPQAKIYRNDLSSTGSFTVLNPDTDGNTTGLEPVANGSVNWGDYDLDGDLDLVVTGRNPNTGTRISAIYTNDVAGSGGFVLYNGDGNGSTTGLTPLQNSDSDWGDFDRDGDLDLVLVGETNDGASLVPYSAVVVNDVNASGGFFVFDGTDGGGTLGLPDVSSGSVEWGDYNQDGAPDLLLTGFDASLSQTAAIVENQMGEVGFVVLNDDGNGGTTGLTPVSDGSGSWGDYDQDGDLDFVLTGRNAGGDVAALYQNTDPTTGSFSLVDPDGTGSTAALTPVRFSDSDWGDADGDGDLDLVLTGNDGGGNQTSIVYQNESTGFIPLNPNPSGTATAALTGVGFGTTANWADVDLDGDLDLFLAGSGSTGVTAGLFRNVNPPTLTLVSGGTDVLGGEVLGIGPGSVGGETVTTSLTVENTSTESDLTVSSIALSNTANFALNAPPLPLTLAPGEATTLSVDLLTGTEGTFQTDLTLLSDDPADPYTVTLEGTVESAAPPILYVSTATGNDGNDGASWGTAFRTLQQALSVVSPGDATEIWIAEGVYYPDQGAGQTPDARTSTFALVDGVNVYGGFAGGEASRAARDPRAHPTILSGDVGQDDTDPDGDGIILNPLNIAGSNAYHVVTAQSFGTETILDGFVVTGGVADGSTFPDNVGGGIFAEAAPFLGVNLVLAGNQGGDGAAGYFSSSSTDLYNSFVVSNTSGTGSILVASGAPLGLVNTLVAGNSASTVMNGAGGSLLVRNSTITRNSGATASSVNASITAENSIIWANSSGTQLIPGDSDSFVSLANVILQGGTSAVDQTNGFLSGSTGVLDVDPQFADPDGADNTAGTLDDNFRLLASSPGIGTGDLALLPTDPGDLNRDGNTTEALPVDLDGEVRVQDSNLDLGAYEGGEPILQATGAVPSLNATNVSVSAPIEITFDKALDSATLSGGSIVIRGSTTGRIAGTFSGAGTTTATFTPDGNYAFGETVTVTVTRSLRATDGSPVGFPISFAFTTEIGSTASVFTETQALPGLSQSSHDFGDYDDDGDLDLIVTGVDGSGTPATDLYLNDGAGQFATSATTFETVQDGDADWGDYDSDGDLDLVLAGLNGNGLSSATVYVNDGAGGLSAATGISLTGIREGTSDWIDVDADGDLDLFVAGSDSDGLPTATLYLNDGSSFVPADAGIGAVTNAASAWGDVNGDGRPDAVVLGRSFDGLPQTEVYLSSVLQASFSPTATALPNLERGDVALSDVNGDGTLDIALTGVDSDGLSVAEVYTNDGSGGFTRTYNAPAPGADASIDVGDVNGDGVPDLIVNGLTASGVYVGDGTGAFAAEPSGLPALADGDVSLGDVNADGDLDLFVSGTDGATTPQRQATLFANQTAPQVVVSTGGTPLANMQTDPVDLGTSTVGTPLTGTFTLENAGAETDLTVNSISASNLDFYSVAAPTLPLVLAPGEAISFDVTLDGSLEATESTLVEVDTDDPDEPLFTFPVTGSIVGATPTVVTNAGLTLTEGTSAPVDATRLEVSDTDTAVENLVFTVTTLPTSGDLTLNGTALTSGGTFTQADVNNGLVAYQHTGTGSGTDAFGFTASDGSSTTAETSFAITIEAADTAPTLAPISDRTIDEDTETGPIGLSVSDGESLEEDLTLTATSDNATLVPDANLGISGPQSNGSATLTATPTPNEFGTATITVTVSDGANVASTDFVLTVNAVNDAPVVSGVADRNVVEDTALSGVDFTVSDIDTPAGDLTVTATSSNLDLLPDANLTLGGAGETRTLDATPLPDSSGTSTITLTVSDGLEQASTSFNLTVTPAVDPPTATTLLAEQVTTTSAQLSGIVDPREGQTTVEFFYFDVADPESSIITVPANESPLTGSGETSVRATLDALEPGTTYVVQFRAENEAGSALSNQIQVTTIDPLTLAPSVALEFPEIGARSTAILPVTIQNTGDQPLSVTAADISGTDASVFQVEALDLPLTLAAGAEQVVNVTYAPTSAAGPQNASLSVASDLETERLPLRGTSVSIPVKTLGRIAVGPQVEETVSVANPFAQDVVVQAIDIVGPDADLFSIVSETSGQNVPAGGALDVRIAVQAAETGTFDADLQVVLAEGTLLRTVEGEALGLQAKAGPDGAIVPRIGTDVPVTIDIPDAFAPDQLTLFYRPAGDPSYQSRIVSLNAGTAAEGTAAEGKAAEGKALVTVPATIPGEAVTERGVQFYVEATETTPDGPLVLTFPAVTPASAPLAFPTRIPLIAAEGPVDAQTYRMYSVPAVPDSSLATLLESQANFGPYDPTRWRAFRYPPSLDRRAQQGLTVEDIDLQEFPDIDGLDDAGTAFWHVTADADRFRVANATSTDPSRVQTITLQPGWNQIGTPFLFPTGWADILEATRAQATEEEQAAVAALGAPVQWDGTEYVYGKDVLEPWQGYFVLNPTPGQPVDLVVPPVGASSSESTPEARQKASAPAPARSVTTWAESTLDASDASGASGAPYRVQLRATLQSEAFDRTLTDAQNWIGILPGATDARGPEDVAEAPPIGEYVRLSIVPDDAPYDVLAGSFKAPTMNGHRWDVDVAARVDEPFVTRKRVTIALTPSGRLPDGFALYVLDLDDRRMLPLDGNTVEVTLDEARPRRSLRVIAGTKGYAEQNGDGIAIGVFENKLLGNYPNPVADETRIAFELERKADVTLTVYDVLGRRVARLLDGDAREAGPHEVVWNARTGARSLASGVYVYRIKAGDFTDTGKMVVVR